MALTNEDLLAISQLLDVKLKAEIQPIKNEIQNLRSEMQTEIRSVNNRIESVEAEVRSVDAKIEAVDAKVHQIKLFQENEIMPRLNTIESCYLSTFNRYKDSVDRYEAMEADNIYCASVKFAVQPDCRPPAKYFPGGHHCKSWRSAV